MHEMCNSVCVPGMPLVPHSPQGFSLPDCHSFTPQNSAPVQGLILSLLGSLFTWLLTRSQRAAATTAYEIIVSSRQFLVVVQEKNPMLWHLIQDFKLGRCTNTQHSIGPQNQSPEANEWFTIFKPKCWREGIKCINLQGFRPWNFQSTDWLENIKLDRNAL
jgi:hypothetical protein